MPEKSPSNVKVFDRPERKALSPLVAVIALVVLLAVGFLLYKMFYHPNTPPVKSQVGLITALGITSYRSVQSNTYLSRL